MSIVTDSLSYYAKADAKFVLETMARRVPRCLVNSETRTGLEIIRQSYNVYLNSGDLSPISSSSLSEYFVLISSSSSLAFLELPHL